MRLIADILPDVLDILERGPRRWALVRTGEREPIPWALRLSVLIRDDYRCKTCGWRDDTGASLELDHCLPWSAGGPDTSDNLRVLCSSCNQRRSNYDDGAHLTRRLPTTWWCMSCWSEPGRPRPIWQDGTDLGAAPLVTEPSFLAFCAWCRTENYTDREAAMAAARAALRGAASEEESNA